MSQNSPTDIEADKYAADFVLHGKQSKAWRHTFPDSKASDDSVDQKASRFHKLDKVQSSIAKMQQVAADTVEEEFSISAADITKRLVDIADMGVQTKIDAQGNTIPINLNGAVSAYSEINRMNGNHATVKTDLTNSDGSLAPKNSDISDEELAKQLAKYGIKR
jgi:hypothetical protein